VPLGQKAFFTSCYGTELHSCKTIQGSQKVLSGTPGQVDFPVGQVTFPCHLSVTGKGLSVVCQSSHKKENTNQHALSWKSYLSEGKAGIHILSEP